MLHPSYTDLMKVVNSSVEEGDTPVVNSRYSIVMATAKRARQIIAGDAAVTPAQAAKPLSTAVAELNEGKIRIMPEQEQTEELIVSEEPEEAEELMVSEEPEDTSEEPEALEEADPVPETPAEEV